MVESGDMAAKPSKVQVVRVDRLMLLTLELEGLLCFRCPVLGKPGIGALDGGECPLRARDLLSVATDAKSGIVAAISGGRIVGYAVFGRPGVFPRLGESPFEVAEDALVVAALYVTPEMLQQSVDADLLIAVMDFAREKSFARVQVLCRAGPGSEPLASAQLLGAAGFELSQDQGGRCFAETTVEAWDLAGQIPADDSLPRTISDWGQSNEAGPKEAKPMKARLNSRWAEFRDLP